jgi:hypothetical protein
MKKRTILISSELLIDKWNDLLKVAVPNAGQLILNTNGFKIYAAISAEGNRTLLVISPAEPPKITEFDAVSVRFLTHENKTWATSFILQYSNFDSEFATLCADMCQEVALSRDSSTALANQYAAYESWLDFYKRSSIFNLEKARGLFGELKFITEQLVPTYSAESILDSWQGPLGGYQDFVLENARAVEIKTVNPSTTDVLISSEHQLSYSGDLTLAVYRILTLDGAGNGETLNELVNRFENGLTGPQRKRFTDLIATTGYKPGLKVSNERKFEVQEIKFFNTKLNDFPRLTESNLPAGIRKVKYRIALAQLAEFQIEGVKF